jgi:hypothetical protein
MAAAGRGEGKQVSIEEAEINMEKHPHGFKSASLGKLFWYLPYLASHPF